MPTGTDDFAADGVDFGLDVGVHRQIGERFSVHGSVGGLFLGEDDTAGLDWERHPLQGELGGTVDLTDDVSLIGQFVAMTPTLEGPGFLGDPRRYLVLGSRWAFRPGLELEFAAAENLDPFDNTADIAFKLGFAATF